MGKTIYLTDKEIKAVRDCCGEWCEIMSTGVETFKTVEQTLNDGLGSALYKLYKGLNGARLYENYIKK
ncbi:MAG: hypothetical protein IJZ96_07605 [Lachnospiraceae bacterium]|nr:hypothetical protein [Lachnospiraceae bacterium]